MFEFLVFVVSLSTLFVGASLITDNSQQLSISLGLPLFLVGALVAVGTCLPETAFALRSCNKKHCELALGSILGNVLADSMLTIGIIATDTTNRACLHCVTIYDRRGDGRFRLPFVPAV